MKYAFPLAIWLALSLCSCSNTPAPAAAPPEFDGGGERPNILLISVDALGWNDLNCYGSPLAATPFLDGLARDGELSLHAYAASPDADESYRALQTGWHPERANNSETVAELARRAGYVTASIGPNEELADRYDERVGEELPAAPAQWHFPFGMADVPPAFATDSSAYLPDVLARQALDAVSDAGEKSWLISLRFPAPPLELDPTEHWRNYYANEISATHWRPYPHPDYAAQISALDAAVGAILTALKDREQLRNTHIIFIGNSGGQSTIDPRTERPFPTQNGILRAGRGTLYEGGLRVPLIVRYPDGVTPPKTRERPLSGLDVYPTVAAVIGRKDFSPSPDGISLLTEDRSARFGPRTLYWSGGDGAVAVRSGDFKMVRTGEDEPPEFHNLRQRPDELVPLSGPPAGVSLIDSLATWRRSLGR